MLGTLLQALQLQNEHQKRQMAVLVRDCSAWRERLAEQIRERDAATAGLCRMAGIAVRSFPLLTMSSPRIMRCVCVHCHRAAADLPCR